MKHNSYTEIKTDQNNTIKIVAVIHDYKIGSLSDTDSVLMWNGSSQKSVSNVPLGSSMYQSIPEEAV